MNKKESSKVHSHLKRQITVWSVFLFPMLLASLLGATPLCRWGVECRKVDVSTMPWILLEVIAFWVAMVRGGLIHLGQVPQVKCPKWGTSIPAGNLVVHAIATGKCGNWNCLVLSEDDTNAVPSRNSPGGGLTREGKN
jgi:hypothetical protein